MINSCFKRSVQNSFQLKASRIYHIQFQSFVFIKIRICKSIAFTLQYLSFYHVKAALSHTNIYAFAKERIDIVIVDFCSKFHRVTIGV